MNYPATKNDILDLRKLIRDKHKKLSVRQALIIKLLATNKILLIKILKAIKN